MTLADAFPGDRLVIDLIRPAKSRADAIRLGLIAGKPITVVKVLPKGPVVVAVGPAEIAVGRLLAQAIEVHRAPAP